MQRNAARLSVNQRRRLADAARACALASGVSGTAWRDWRKGSDAKGTQRDLMMLADPFGEAERIAERYRGAA